MEFKENLAGIKILQVVKVLGIDVVMLEESEKAV